MGPGTLGKAREGSSGACAKRREVRRLLAQRRSLISFHRPTGTNRDFIWARDPVHKADLVRVLWAHAPARA